MRAKPKAKRVTVKDGRQFLEKERDDLTGTLERHLSGEARLEPHKRDATAWLLRFTLQKLETMGAAQ